MENLKPNASEIIINNSQTKDVVCESFVYEPDNIEEEKLGFLYIVSRAKSSEENQTSIISFLNIIASRISQSFYTKTGFFPKEALEKTLGEANLEIKKSLGKEENRWFKSLDMAVFLVSPNKTEVSFSIVGSAQGLLWRKGQLVNITKDFILENSEEVAFKSFASGKIEREDKLILSIPPLTAQLTKSKIKEQIDKYRYEDINAFVNSLELGKDKNIALIALNIGSVKEASTKVISTKDQANLVESKEKLTEVRKEKKKNFLRILTRLGKLIKSFSKKSFLLIKKIKLEEKIKKVFEKTSLVLKSGNEKSVNLNKIDLKRLKIKKKYVFIAIFSLIFIVLAIVLVNRTPTQENHEEESPADKKNIALEELEPLLDIKQQTLSLNAKGVVFKDNKLILFDESAFYIFDLERKSGDFIFPQTPQGTKFNHQAEVEQSFLYLSPSNKILLLDKNIFEQDLKNISGIENEDILDMASFLDNVYVLTASGKIIKYPNLDFASPSVWMDKTADFGSSFVSFAIDGSIYVLEKSGIIHRYSKGKIENDYLITVSGMADIGDKIFTKPDFKNIYLMSASQKKIFIFDKETQTLIKSFSDESWQELTDIYINPEETNLYLLADFKVYDVEI